MIIPFYNLSLLNACARHSQYSTGLLLRSLSLFKRNDIRRPHFDLHSLFASKTKRQLKQKKRKQAQGGQNAEFFFRSFHSSISSHWIQRVIYPTTKKMGNSNWSPSRPSKVAFCTRAAPTPSRISLTTLS